MFVDGNWNVGQGEYEGDPIILRINASLNDFVGDSEYNLKIGVAIPLNNPDPGGMPDPEENEVLAEYEDRIGNIINQHGSAVQALAITMGTFKEYVFYATRETNVKLAHEQMMAEIDTHEVQCYAEVEKDWATYSQWL